MEYPAALKELIAALRLLPSIGPRTAERLALALVEGDRSLGERLERTLCQVREQVAPCPQCGFYATPQTRCAICADPRRDEGLLCVVEYSQDILKFEKSGHFHGRYHALGGRLSPLDGIGPEQLRMTELLQRVREIKPREVVLALSADVEGETTALYVAPLLKAEGVAVSRLATGLPAGGGLEFVDSVTLGYALSGRKTI